MTNETIKNLKATKEYKAWQESLLAIIGYTTDEKLNDEKLAEELMADHLNASIELQKGVEQAKYKTGKDLHDEWLLDNCGQ